MRVFAFFCLFLAALPGVFGQIQQFEPLQFPVTVNGKNLAYPFAGGLNQAQISPADLNGDGVLDLVVFDRAGDAILTFVHNLTGGTAAYKYIPEYACFFPPCSDWMLLRDFDGDGAADIFCSSLRPGSLGVQVFKGYFENKILKFRPFKFHYPNCLTCDTDIVYYPDEMPGFWNNLTVSTDDIPEFNDINGDGDIDILTFEASVGGHIWLLENQSVERGFGRDSLIFEAKDKCWGDFYESGLIACKNCLGTTTDACCLGLTGDGGADDRDGLHPGSTVMTFDQEGDGDMEVVLGDISFSCLNMMINGGTKANAWMMAQDTAFPSYSDPVDLAGFPAAFYLDVDGDGAKDMLVCPSGRGVVEDINNVWFYKNHGSNSNHDFELESRSLLTRDMIDVGTIAHPALADVDGDGLLDIVVGNFGFFTPGNANNARLYLFLNTGTHAEPKFQLTDTDWLGMSQFAPNDYDFAPAFGDLDGDGDLDLLVGGFGGWFYHYENTAGAGNPMQMKYDADPFWLTIDPGISSTPFIHDVNRDGLPDLLVGERKGNVNYFKNRGTPTQFKFNSVEDVEKLGAIDVKIFGEVVGHASPAVAQTPDGLLLVVGNQDGKLEAYQLTDSTANPLPLVSKTWGNVDVGSRAHPALADLDGDGLLEMVVGTQRGGLQLFRTRLVNCEQGAVSTQPEPTAEFAIKIFPNPARHSARVRVEHPSSLIPHAYNWRVFNLLGQTVANGEANAATFELDVNGWQSGVYVLELEIGGQVSAVRFVKN